VLKAFTLALLTMTTVFVLVMVFAEASKLGLTPQDISRLVPYIIPSTLPYTVPVSLLFAVSVVYGRLAGDNEVVAIKAAGQSVVTVLLPSLVMAAVLSLTLFTLNTEAIPRCNKAIKDMLYRNFEDFFFKTLRKNKEFNKPQFPYFISVRDVEGNVLIGPTFMHRVKEPEGPVTYDAVAIAERAEVHFNLKQNVIRLSVDKAQFLKGGPSPQFVFLNDHTLELPLPLNNSEEPKVQELTTLELQARLAKRLKQAQYEQPRQAAAAALWIASGRIGRVAWNDVRDAYVNVRYWKMDAHALETEKHVRISLALAAFFFVLLGAPVGIRFAKRDFLSAFITCFLPIILLYYPLTLLGINLGKEGQISPAIALAMGNVVLATLAGIFALPPVLRH
jgi:lipopolysaccharide export system permease protein